MFIKANKLTKGTSYIAEKLDRDTVTLIFHYIGRNSENDLLLNVECVIKGDDTDVELSEIQIITEDEWNKNSMNLLVRPTTKAEKILYGRKDV